MRAPTTPDGTVRRRHSTRRNLVLLESGAGRLSAKSSTRLRRTDPSAPAIGEARGHGLPIRAALYSSAAATSN